MSDDDDTSAPEDSFHVAANIPVNHQQERRNPPRQRKFPPRLDDYEVYVALSAICAVEDAPKSYSEVNERDDAAEWREAVGSEMQSLEENQTWEVVDKPPGAKQIGTKWIFKRKPMTDGSSRCKARLVVQGFLQKEGVDFTETYAPVARLPIF